MPDRDDPSPLEPGLPEDGPGRKVWPPRSRTGDGPAPPLPMSGREWYNSLPDGTGRRGDEDWDGRSGPALLPWAPVIGVAAALAVVAGGWLWITHEPAEPARPAAVSQSPTPSQPGTLSFYVTPSPRTSRSARPTRKPRPSASATPPAAKPDPARPRPAKPRPTKPAQADPVPADEPAAPVPTGGPQQPPPPCEPGAGLDPVTGACVLQEPPIGG
ncbi:hypothetical protein [Nonomuraea sp. NPDC050310]|uniref:hypothetical protein n=1 Tax=Nonomuraea sp. NPDC050310 TaxID=3154935 RepID=UPI0034030869